MASDPVSIHTRYTPDPQKQENYTLFCGSHTVNTVVTAKPAVVRKWIHRVLQRHRIQRRRGRLVVGLGVQWAPERNKVASTLQLCAGHWCLIFQLEYANRCPDVLRRFLSDTHFIFVGFRNKRDAPLLEKSTHSLWVHRVVDLPHKARHLKGGARNASMEKLAAEILEMPGIVKEKSVGRSNWGNDWLSEEQVKYACLDAFLAFLVGKELIKSGHWVEVDD